MILTSLHVKNFRSLRDIAIPVHELTVLIGENDAGKSSILDVLDIVLNDETPEMRDFFRSADGKTAEKIEVELSFDVEWSTLSETERAYIAPDGKIHIRREYTTNSKTLEYRGEKCEDERLNGDLSKLRVSDLDEIMQEYGIVLSERPNKQQRVEAIETYRKAAPKTECWMDAPTSIWNLLPRFDRYRSIDYREPAEFIQKTLQSVYEDTIFETTEEGGKILVADLSRLEEQVTISINSRVTQLLDHVRLYDERVQDIDYQPRVDFSRGLKLGNFRVDIGTGLTYLSNTGDGTKRRVFMAVLDWDREIAQTRTSRRSIIRGYDEPDTNLHYEAQRKMYNAISGVALAPGFQALICTHSLTLIDHAPARSINVLTRDPSSGITDISYLEVEEEDADVEEFLCGLARELGLSNTVLFYERCYILIEGATEENALPLLYHKMFTRFPIDDGIRLINLEGKSARRPILRILGQNRSDITLSLIDSDAKPFFENELAVVEFKADIDHVIWIGVKEFEDAFSDEVICRCLDRQWSRQDERSWRAEDIQPLRERARTSTRNKDKFSDNLIKMVNRETLGGITASKPELGRAIGRTCTVEDIPQPIRELFTKAREIAHCS